MHERRRSAAPSDEETFLMLGNESPRRSSAAQAKIAVAFEVRPKSELGRRKIDRALRIGEKRSMQVDAQIARARSIGSAW
jgi:hypothetical protein